MSLIFRFEVGSFDIQSVSAIVLLTLLFSYSLNFTV